ncbi:hypothetical protein ACYJ80_10500 [Staphylococcus capitis]|uniref:Conserved domain protein n=9 Tax=Staphylococcus TaxID=1279 RepID=Q5HML8_STAEQ|nr:MULTISPECIES: hypothetical protein [Staphylococcus]YP_009226697.1 hypothetical protein AXJ01_gp021 [Staphylococcus phage SPbeta-like]EON79609.1 hypothetical protein H701_13826 [Staphylococcus epidermidis 528m]EON79615.1 hypothetical protein H700_13508 [Staphylococcus epidermidis 41tr]EON86435.1 hypothetical protein D592_04280 [Staphylococcus epidermidis 36-1]KKD21754.1 hypothetical protein XA21_11815 [Staphylococcus cohnii subsp. cohnii]QPB07778.1 hypothetical protein PLKLOBMN_00207 [Staph
MLNIENLTNRNIVKINEKVRNEVLEYFKGFEEITEIEDQQFYNRILEDLTIFLSVNNLSFSDVEQYFNNNDICDDYDIYRLLKYLYYFDNVKDYQEFINEYVTNFENEINIINKNDNYILIAYVPNEEW